MGVFETRLRAGERRCGEKVGGSLVSSQIEAKLAELYAKAGISADRFSVTFNTDSSFVCQLKNRSIGGTFSVDGETGQISLKYGAVEGLAGAGSLNLYVRKTGDRIRLLFKADKLLEIVSAVANMTQNATVTQSARWRRLMTVCCSAAS